jgi:5,10-methylenetetrahydrofolate reductase
MLSASALGIVNIAVSDSEEPSVGDHPEAVAVNDLEPLDLLHAVSAMQEGKDLAGQPLQGSPEFVIGIRLQSIAPGVKPEKEMTMLRQFSNLGVTFVITPPVFEIDPLLALRDTIKSEKISIIPSILLLKSVGMARYIQAHSEQIHIPESIINRLQHCDSIPREVAKITEELMSSFRNNGFSGVLISSRGWESLIKEILEEQ